MRTINKALFLDLDGTVIVTKSGEIFAKTKDDWQFNKNILQKIEEYVDKGWYIMFVSNQGGIETGTVKLNDFRQKIKAVTNEILITTGCPFQRLGYRFTVTNNPEDFYRKPNPGMAYDLALSYILDLSECIMVGDASGRIRKQILTYRDLSSPTHWSYENGEFLAPKEASMVQENIGNTGYLITRDFSNSDFKFAMSSGMAYIDIEDFLANTREPIKNQTKY